MTISSTERTAEIAQRPVKLGSATVDALLLAFIIFFAVFPLLGAAAGSSLVFFDPSITLALGTIVGAAFGYLVGASTRAGIISKKVRTD